MSELDKFLHITDIMKMAIQRQWAYRLGTVVTTFFAIFFALYNETGEPLSTMTYIKAALSLALALLIGFFVVNPSATSKKITMAMEESARRRNPITLSRTEDPNPRELKLLDKELQEAAISELEDKSKLSELEKIAKGKK